MADEAVPLEELVANVERRKAREATPTPASTVAPTVPTTRSAEPIPVSIEDLSRNVDRIWTTLQTIEQDEPWLTHGIAGSESAMALTQEVSAGLHQSEVTSYAISAMLGDEAGELKAFDDVIHRLDNNSKLVGQFFQDYSGDFNSHEKDFLAFLLYPLDAARKDQTLALANQYIEAYGIDTDEQRANFMVFTAQTAGGKLNETKAETDTFLGRMGGIVDAGGKPLREAAAQAWAVVADPADSTYREHLSIGQNMMISFAQTPGTAGWQIGSGIADGIAQFTLDPTNLVVGLGAGTKLARTFPLIADASKASTVARAAVPWFGKNVTSLPRFSRGFTTRLGWALNARTIDQLFTTGRGTHVAQAMYDAVQKGGVSRLIEQFPMMANAIDGIGDLIAKADNPNQIVDVMKEALSGGFLKADGVGRSQLKNAFEQAEGTYNSAVDEALDSGEIGLGDVGGFEGFDPTTTRVFSVSGEIRGGAALGVETLGDTNEVRLVFRGKEKTVDLTDPQEAAAFARWVEESPEATSPVWREFLDNPGDFFLHGAKETIDGDELRKGGLVTGDSMSAAEITAEYARRGGADGTMVIIRKSDLPERYRDKELISRLYSGGADVPEELTGVMDEFAQLSLSEFTARFDELDEAVKGAGIEGGVPALLNVNTADEAYVALTRTAPSIPVAETLPVGFFESSLGFDNVLANRILAGNFSFTDEMVARLNTYATSVGADTISFGDNAILTTRGAERAVSGVDKTTDATRLVALTRDKASDLIHKRHQYDTAVKQDTSLWVLNEMPERPPRGLNAKVKGLWRNTASNDSNSWWAQSRRMASARIFNKSAPNSISIDNTAEMVEGFRRLARSFGARRTWINDKINELAGTQFMDRYDAVQRAIVELAEEADHPLLQHRLVEYVKDQGLREFMPGPGGSEMATAVSRSDGVTQTAVPLIPSLMRRQVQLPGPDFYRSLKRYRQVKNSKLPFITGRGVTAGTRRNRAQIVARLKRRLEAKMEANPDLTGIIKPMLADEDKLFAMAYGSVMDSGVGNGVGLLAKFGAGLGKGLYTPIHSVFSVAQLAFRPVSWMLRVNLDEQARGALFDLPSIFRNPGRYAQNWWDAYHIAKAEKWAAANSTWAAQTAEAILRGGDEAVLKNVFEVFPDARKALGETPAPRAVRNYVQGQLRDIAQGGQPLRTISNQMDMGRWATRRTRQRARGLKRVKGVEERYGLAPRFEWDDANEIQMKGVHQILVEEMGGSVTPMDWTPGITQRGAYDYGTAWASKAGQYARDPVMQVAMRAAAKQAKGKSVRREAARIVRSGNWHELRQNYYRVAVKNGWDDVLRDDVALAERVLERVLIPQVDHIFAPLWNSATDVVSTKARVLEDILSPGRTATFTAHDGLEYTFDFRKGSSSRLRTAMREFAGEEQARQAIPGAPLAGMPDRIAAYFDPMYAADDGRRGIPAAWRKFTDWSIGTFGERATQGLNRRPAYLAAHKRAFQRYKAMGLDDDAARMASHGEAVRLVNYVYYNMDDTVPILQKMNKIIPFFSAAWEVAQTWAFKIPKELAGGAGFVMGWPRMARSVDRYFDAFINSGLLQVTDDGMYELVLSQDLGMGEALPVSNFLSRMGNDIANTPFTIVEHLANISNDLRGIDEEVDLGAPEIRIRVAAPIDPVGEGVGNALSFHLGLNPLIASATGTFKDRIYEAVDGKTVTVEGRTFAEIEEATEISAAELLRANKLVIQDAIGKAEYNKLLRGETDLAGYELPSYLELRIPRSSLVGGVVDELFFAFDSSSSPFGTFYHMQPSWSKYIWKGLGLWAGNGGHPPGFLEIFDGPSGEAQMRSAVVDALRRLEANEGAVSALDRERNRLSTFVNESRDIFVYDAISGDIAPAEGASPLAFAEAEEQFQELWEDVNDRSEYLLARAGDLAGGQLLTRGLFGLFMPSNPQTFTAQSHLEDAYYTSRDFVAGEGLPEIRNATDYETFATLMTAWWEDDTGDAAKNILQELYPGMEMWWKGKSYWADGTVPIEAFEIEDHFRLVGDGDIEMKPPEVWLMDEAKGGMSLLKEAEIRQRFGSDGPEAVRNILTNYTDYKALGEEIELGYAELEWFDDLFFDGAYADFQNRERRTAPRLAEELKLATIDKFKNLDALSDIIADISDATPDEQADLARQLGQANRENRDRIYELFDLPEYEGAITERERILNEWWKQVDGYYEQVDAIFAPLSDPTLTSEERGLVFENWRVFQNEMHGQPIIIDGVEYPNELERSWSSKTEEEKQRKRLRDVSKKPEWLSTIQVEHLVERYPDAAQYMPQDMEMYDALTQFKNTTKAAVEAGEISQYRANQMNDEATEVFNVTLAEQGRWKELQWINSTPMERLELLDDVPPYLEAIMPYYANLVGNLRANDVSLKSTSADARIIKSAFFGAVAEHLSTVPGGAQSFVDLGLIMFGDDFDAPDEIGAVLFFNDRFSDL